MSEILESSTWENTIYQISKDDLVLGGVPNIEDGVVISGVANIASRQLTNRTNYLKSRTDTNTNAITALNIQMSTANSNILTAAHRLDILEPIVATITASVVLAADEARASAQTAGVHASNAGVSAAAAAASAVIAQNAVIDASAATNAAAAAAASATAANTSKTDAATSATSATGSKNAAALSATAAAGSASDASASAIAANSSKNAAATSATNAGNSATASSSSASDAATSATAAANAVTNVGSLVSAADASKTAAAGSATAAANSATAADTSKTAAAGSATAAAGSATAAAGSASAALGSANNADASKTAATASKDAAALSATNAGNAAIAAAASAAEALANAISHYKGLYTSLEALTAGVVVPIAGNYADVDAGAGIDVKRYIWDTSDNKWVTSAGDGTGPSLTAPQIKVLYESNPNTNAYPDADKAKLGGISAGATVNDTDANLKARANHTGTQAISTVSGLQTALDAHTAGISDLDTRKVEKVAGKALSTNDYSDADKLKLGGVAAAATANDTDANLKNRANHTGAQAISTVTGLQTALDGLVVKVGGKQLSTEDYTTTEKTKLGGISAGATVNDTDANLKNRANHTGTQAISTITGLQAALDAAGSSGGGGAGIDDTATFTTKTYSSVKIAALDAATNARVDTVVSNLSSTASDLDSRKVEKVTGKDLSSNDYTTVEKNKLASMTTPVPVVATTTVSALAAAASSIVNMSGSFAPNNLILEVDVVSTGSYTIEFYNSTNATGTLLYKGQLITGNYNDKFSYFAVTGSTALSMKITNNGTSALTATVKFTYLKLA